MQHLKQWAWIRPNGCVMDLLRVDQQWIQGQQGVQVQMRAFMDQVLQKPGDLLTRFR